MRLLEQEGFLYGDLAEKLTILSEASQFEQFV
jgi:hypothetical protein